MGSRWAWLVLVACAAGAIALARADDRGPVARVGPETIGRAELDQAADLALERYRTRTGAEIDPALEPLVRRQVLENLIQSRLLSLEGRRRGVTVTDAEIQAQMRREKYFQTNGAFDEAKYLGLKASNPAAFAQAMTAVRVGLATRKASQEMERLTRPDDDAIRTELKRELSQATIEFISLHKSDFDGSGPEPRESEILAAYAANSARYRVPESRSLSVIPIEEPSLDDSAAASDAGTRAWEQHLRARADSALRAIRGGAPFPTIAALHHGMKSMIPFRRDQLPEFWRGTADDVEAVSAAAAGSVVAQPVRGAAGWVVVRVDSIIPAHVARLRDVSNQIRAELRAAARSRPYEDDLRRAYAAVRDSLRGVAYRIRYAVADTASFMPGTPRPDELDRYYRAHLADYSAYDRTTNSVVEQPLAVVRDEVRARWAQERRQEAAREAAERVRDAWKSGRRTPALEQSMTAVRETGPVVTGSPADSGRVGRDLDAALKELRGRVGVVMTATASGYLVCHLVEVVPDYTPTLEQSRAMLADRVVALHAADKEAAAKAAFLRDPTAYRSPARIEFSRMVVPQPSPEQVDLTHAEVERYYQAHLNRFSVEELVHVRHILISPAGPGPQADSAARVKAEEVLRRVRAGDDFSKLAAQYSDDTATSQEGGDLGVFRHGMMLEAVERAAFAMRPGDITGPVLSPVGYHVMECLEYLPPKVHPLPQVYTNVARVCAREKAVRLTAQRADSILHTLRGVRDALAVAKRLHLDVIQSEQIVGQYAGYDRTLRPYIEKIETLKPHTLYPGVQRYLGKGYVITWVDSIVPPATPTWEGVRARAGQIYQREMGDRAMVAKAAELDSMLARGWSLDSLATLWGGLQRVVESPSRKELGGIGGRALLDSLVFGGERPPGLQLGQVSHWVAFPGGITKLRIAERRPPEPEELSSRLASRRKLTLLKKSNQYYDRLKERFPVEILDPELRATVLAEPTEP